MAEFFVNRNCRSFSGFFCFFVSFLINGGIQKNTKIQWVLHKGVSLSLSS